MRDIKRIMPMFTFYDRTGIQSYLENQAKKGWLLEKIGNFTWNFRRIEPRELRFSVNYFPKASAFDAEPSEQQKQFLEFCAHTGWMLAASSAQMNIFYNEAQNPVPIDTDAELEVENIHKSMKKSILPSYSIMLVCALLQMFICGGTFLRDPISVLVNKFQLFTIFCWIMVLMIECVEIGTYFWWIRKARKAAQADGSFIETRGHRGFQIATVVILLVAVSLLLLSLNDSIAIGAVAMVTILLVVVITVLVLEISKLMKKLKFSAKLNFAVTCIAIIVLSVGMTVGLMALILTNVNWSFEEDAATYEHEGMTFYEYEDELPLKIEELRDVDYEHYSYELWEEETMFLAKYEARQLARVGVVDEPELSYVVLDIKIPFLYDWCLEKLLQDFTHNYFEDDSVMIDAVPVDEKPWGASKVYQLYEDDTLMNSYLLCYDDCIVEFLPNWEMTEEEMRLVGEKFA